MGKNILILYSDLGLEFHIKSINEILRICKELRIFPIVNLSNEKTKILYDIIDYYKEEYEVTIKETEYGFQKGAYKMLAIKHKVQ